ncbi:MAG: hypothetical protein ACE5FJ_08400 [Gemmatimonadales bacterium]
MSEKPIAIILAGIGVVSLCTICVLGPAALGAAVGWAFGWVTDLSPMATIGVTLFSALAVYALFRRWGAVRRDEEPQSSALSDVTEAKE